MGFSRLWNVDVNSVTLRYVELDLELREDDRQSCFWCHGVTEAGYCPLIGAGNSVAWLAKQDVTLKAEVSVIPCIYFAREYSCG